MTDDVGESQNVDEIDPGEEHDTPTRVEEAMREAQGLIGSNVELDDVTYTVVDCTLAQSNMQRVDGSQVLLTNTFRVALHPAGAIPGSVDLIEAFLCRHCQLVRSRRGQITYHLRECPKRAEFLETSENGDDGPRRRQYIPADIRDMTIGDALNLGRENARLRRDLERTGEALLEERRRRRAAEGLVSTVRRAAAVLTEASQHASGTTAGNSQQP